MLIKKYKNITGSTVTRVGQQVGAGAYYQIDPFEETQWMENSQVEADIIAGNAIMNDGTADIPDPTESLDYLRAVSATCIREGVIETDSPEDGESPMWDSSQEKFELKVADFERILVDEDGETLVNEDFNLLIGD